MRKFSVVRNMRLAIIMGLASMPLLSAAETLDEAWETAIYADKRLASAHAQKESAEFTLAATRAERYPSIDLITSLVQVDEAPRFAFGDAFISPQLFGGNNFLSGSAQVRMPLYTSGRIRHEIDSAVSSLQASEYQVASILQDLKLRVAVSYIHVLRSGQALEVADSTAKSLQAHTTDARNQYENGAVAHNDYLAASAELANAKQRLLRAGNALEIARSSYNRQLGRTLDAPVVLDEAITQDRDAKELDDLDLLIATAISDRANLRAYEAQVQALHEQADVVRSRVRPQLSMSGGYTYLENSVLDDDQFWWIGVGAVWNAFDSGRTGNRAAAIERQAVALERELEDIKSAIALDVRQAWFDWHEAKQRTLVTATAIEQALENLRVTRERYLAGAGTNTEVLDAEALRTLSLNNRNNAIYDTVLARMRLHRATGRL